LAKLLQEVFGKHQQIIPTLAKRRNIQDEHIDSIVQILAEPTVADRLLEVDIRCSEQTKIDWHGGGGPEPGHVPILKHAQQGRLKRHRKLADLVEEQRASVSRFDSADSARPRASKRMSLVPEQLRLHQRGRDRTAVHGNHRPSATARTLVNRPGNELLACACFPDDQHWRISLGDLIDGPH
jgi:hypothetical protein